MEFPWLWIVWALVIVAYLGGMDPGALIGATLLVSGMGAVIYAHWLDKQ